jgi:hypothetical protein
MSNHGVFKMACTLERGLEPMSWTYQPPKSQGSYLVVEKPWRHIVVAYYCPIMTNPWSIHGRWYALDAVECWQPLPPLPVCHDQA